MELAQRVFGAPGPWQTARLERIEPLTSKVRSFFLAPSIPFEFVAGQHVDVRLTAPDGYRAQRSYSIASMPERPALIELSIERLEDGEVSPFFHDVAAVGDEIELRGPIGGYFNWSVDRGTPLLLIGGGSGLVPLMSMIRHWRARASQLPVLLLLSASAHDEILFGDELRAIAANETGFSLILTTTREPARRPGDFDRRVDPGMMREVLARAPAGAEIFICGSNGFVEAAGQGLVDAGVDRGSIRTERFGG